MSIKKNFHRPGPVCQVTFSLPEAAVNGGRRVHLLGEFNGWESENAIPMLLKDGAFTATVDLPIGRAYQFRYLIDGLRWENDWAADGYCANPFGQENSVVTIESSDN